MDKLTKGFVIAASSVVIAVGGVWLYQKYTAHQAMEKCLAEKVADRDNNGSLAPSHWHTEMSKTDKREWVRYACVESLQMNGLLSN